MMTENPKTGVLFGADLKERERGGGGALNI